MILPFALSFKVAVKVTGLPTLIVLISLKVTVKLFLTTTNTLTLLEASYLGVLDKLATIV